MAELLHLLLLSLTPLCPVTEALILLQGRGAPGLQEAADEGMVLVVTTNVFTPSALLSHHLPNRHLNFIKLTLMVCLWSYSGELLYLADLNRVLNSL